MGFACIPSSHKRNFKPPDNTEDGEQHDSILSFFISIWPIMRGP